MLLLLLLLLLLTSLLLLKWPSLLGGLAFLVLSSSPLSHFYHPPPPLHVLCFRSSPSFFSFCSPVRQFIPPLYSLNVCAFILPISSPSPTCTCLSSHLLRYTDTSFVCACFVFSCVCDSFVHFFIDRVVVLSGVAPAQRRRVSTLCRKFGAAFYIVETFGYDG